jgi:hypothetical protein
MTSPQARKDRLTIRELTEETLVYDLERHKAHCLNATAAVVWKHCDGKTPLAELARILKADHKVSEPEAALSLALEQLSRRHLLQETTVPVSGSQRLSRREALKKVAATAVALPLVMTITAPLARINASMVSIRNCQTVSMPSGRLTGNAPDGTSCVPIGTFGTTKGTCKAGTCVAQVANCGPGITPCPTGTCSGGLSCSNGCCV